VFGNGLPFVGAPAFTEFVRPARPCAIGGVAFALWQPLQVSVSPGMDLQPVGVAAAEHAAERTAARVEHADVERHVWPAPSPSPSRPARSAQ
jgi:hypothetical protein